MGAVKVNNDEIWDEYVKSGKVKGFSIEGYFADKVEASKVDKEEEEAKELLAKIESIVKGEKVELALVDNFIKEVDIAAKKSDTAIDNVIDIKKVLNKSKSELDQVIQSLRTLAGGQSRIRKMYAELGIEPEAKLEAAFKKRSNVEIEVEELIKKINGLIGMI